MQKKSLVLKGLDPEVLRQQVNLFERISSELRQLGSPGFRLVADATELLRSIQEADKGGQTLPDNNVATLADDLSQVMNRMFNNKILSRPDFLALSRAINFLRNGKFPMEVKCEDCNSSEGS